MRADVVGAPASSFLFLDVAEGLRSAEVDVTDYQRHLAYAYKPTADDAKSIGFGKLDPGESQLASGPLSWRRPALRWWRSRRPREKSRRRRGARRLLTSPT